MEVEDDDEEIEVPRFLYEKIPGDRITASEWALDYLYDFWPLGEIYPNEVKVVEAWCEEHFGPGVLFAMEEHARWATNRGGVFWFRDEDDAFHFRMRWC